MTVKPAAVKSATVEATTMKSTTVEPTTMESTAVTPTREFPLPHLGRSGQCRVRQNQ